MRTSSRGYRIQMLLSWLSSSFNRSGLSLIFWLLRWFCVKILDFGGGGIVFTNLTSRDDNK